MLDNRLINLLQLDKITYDKEVDVIYINGVEANTYDIRVICAKIQERLNINIDENKLKEILSSEELNKPIENTDNDENTISDIISIIDEDSSIPHSEWEQYKIWKETKAIWHIDKDGEKTSIIDCFDNIVGFLENFPKTKGKIKFNNIRNIVEYNDKQVVDGDYHTFINYINKYFISTFSKIKMVKDACDNVANKNKYNPWTEYFDSLKYVDDGVDYIDYTIKNVLCCEEQEKYYDLYYETLKIMFLGSMNRIYNKELYNKATKYDMVVALCGTNGGSGKTTFFERLFDLDDKGNSYCYVVAGDSFKPSDKDFVERSHQCVCLFLDEVSMKRAIVTSVKGYITQQDDRFRKSFGFNNEAHLRGFIITASSNNTDILKDYTTDNERRWAIIKISEDRKNYENVNKAFDEGYRDKIWAFIKNIYDNDKDYKLFIEPGSELDKLEQEIQRGYKASNNEDYDTIVNDLLEREYGFYDIEYIDADIIVSQYKYGDSEQWCKEHNEEYHEKQRKARDEKYIMRPEDRPIKFWGKIDRIQKTVLYDIIDKLRIEYTKPSLAAEMRVSGRWNGYDNKPCKICGKPVKAYWRTEKTERIGFENDSLPF